MKKLFVILLCLTGFALWPVLSIADVKVNGLLDIEQGGGIKFYDGTLFSSKGITGSVGLPGVDGTSVTSVVLPVGDSNCSTGGIQLTSVSGVSYVCNGADAGEPLKYGKVAVVAQSGGQYISPQAALSDVALWCGTPSASNICQVQIMAGVYDLGSISLQLIPYVNIHGSGQSTTILSGSINSPNSGVVNGASDVLVSDLSIINTGGTTAQGEAFVSAIAVFNHNAVLGLQNVAVKSSGALNTYAVYNTASTQMNRQMIIRDSVLSAETTAVFNGINTNTFVRTTRFDGVGGVENQGKIICSANFIATQQQMVISNIGGNFGGMDFVAVGCPAGGYGFSIVSVTPASNLGYPNGTLMSTSAPINTIIAAVFDQDMNVSTINASTFLVKSSSGVHVVGNVSYNATNRTAVFTPNAPLLPNTTFTVNISSSVRDSRGGKMFSYYGGTDYSWSFQTSAAADSTPLTTSYLYPAEGAVIDAAQNGMYGQFSISVGFGRQIDPLSISSSTIVLKDEAGTTVPGLSSYTNNVNGYATAGIYSTSAPFQGNSVGTVQFYPTSQLAYGKTFTATISGVKDIAGNTLSAPLSWSFSTIGGVAPAGVSAVRSAGNIVVSWAAVPGATGYNLYYCSATGFPAGGVACAGSGSATTNYYYGPSTTSSVSATASFTNITSPYTNTGPFTEGSQYTYFVKAVFAGKEGSPSNSASAFYDNTNPTVVSHGNLDVLFSETIDQSTVVNNFTVRDESGNLIGGYVGTGYSCNYTCVQNTTFHPSIPLQGGVTYTVTLSTGIRDFAGNALQTPVTWSFIQPIGTLTATSSGKAVNISWPAVAGASGYTLYWAPQPQPYYQVNQTSAFKVSVAGTSYTQVNMPDGYYSYLVTYTKGGAESAASSPVSVTVRAIIQSPLIITGSNPDNNATGVISTNPIWINVYPAIDPTSCSPANFSLIDSLNNIVPVRISNCYPDSTFVIVTPVSPLEKSESYSLVITGLKSQAGLVMISPHTLSFTTGTYIPQSFTPSGVSVSVGAGEATLMWSPANNAVKYNIYWSITSDLTTSNGAKASIAIPPFVHTGLSTGTGYFYIVTSENSDAIESSASSVVAVTAK